MEALNANLDTMAIHPNVHKRTEKCQHISQAEEKEPVGPETRF